MSLTRSIGNTHSPHFYAEMGELISNSGQENFAANMLHLVDKWVPIQLVDLSEWTLDELRDSVREIKLLGSAGLVFVLYFALKPVFRRMTPRLMKNEELGITDGPPRRG